MLSMKAKYALRALMMLARREKQTVQIGTISREENVPKKFLELILLELKNHGLVISKRGILGGYGLARSPAEITVGEVIRMIDGPLAPIRCASLTAYQKCDDCEDEATCVIRKVMVQVRHAISGVLDHKTLAELTAMSPKEKRSILG